MWVETGGLLTKGKKDKQKRREVKGEAILEGRGGWALVVAQVGTGPSGSDLGDSVGQPLDPGRRQGASTFPTGTGAFPRGGTHGRVRGRPPNVSGTRKGRVCPGFSAWGLHVSAQDQVRGRRAPLP